MKNICIYGLIIVLIVCVNSCVLSKRQLNSTADISRLIKEIYEEENQDSFESLCSQLNNSIKKHKDVRVFVTEDINENDSTLYKKFINRSDLGIYHYEDKVIDLDICIKNKDLILINSNSVNSDDIKYSQDSIIRNDFWKEYIELKSKKSVFKTVVRINMNLFGKQLISPKEWKVFFRCFNETIFLFEKLKNDFSLNIYGTEFTELKFDEKKNLLDIMNMGVLLTFISECEQPIYPSSEHDEVIN